MPRGCELKHTDIFGILTVGAGRRTALTERARMINAIRQEVVVLPGGRIEIVSPELTPGARAEVIVLERAQGKSGKRRAVGVKGPLGLAQRRAFMRLPIRERRLILAEQARRMAGYYEQDAEVHDLGGGDFVDC